MRRRPVFTLDFLSRERERLKPQLELEEGTPVPDIGNTVAFGDDQEYTVERRIFEYGLRDEQGTPVAVYLVCTPREAS
jgi:hypothetical protein